MKRRQFLATTSVLAISCGTTFAQAASKDDDAAIRAMVQRYVDARVSEDSKVIEALLTPDADQLVSDGTWRRGRDELVKGMLESTKKNPARPTIAVESVRMLSPDVAMADGRYSLKARPGGTDREMWTAITLKRGPDGWRIAAIRNMLPTEASRPTAMADAPDPQTVLNEAQSLAAQGRFDEALQKHLWFHENALRIEPAMSGVRLSFALANWVKLGESYPKARQTLVAIRDKDVEIIKAGAGTSDIFSDVASIDNHLDEPSKTVELFKFIDAQRPKLADRCYLYAEETLAEAREYALCGKYIPDPEAKFRMDARLYKMGMDRARSRPKDCEIPDFAGPMFVENSCRLIEILVGAGRKTEAEKIQKLALAIHDDPKIRDAISKGEPGSK